MVLEVLREYLRERSWITVPVPVISDDKHRDSAATQAFISAALLGEDGWLRSEVTHAAFPWLRDSVKNKFTLSFLNEILRDFPYLERTTWWYGAPGHGKGPWDGFGGILNNTTIRAILALEPYFDCFDDVFKFMKEIFTSDAVVQRYANSPDICTKVWGFFKLVRKDVESKREEVGKTAS
jgi:hypothetical protein